MKIFKTIVILTVAALFVFVGCDKNELVKPEEDVKISTKQVYTDLSGIEVKHGMLVFKSQEQLRELTEHIMQMTKEELNNWEVSIGFESQQRILDQAFEIEMAFFNVYDPEEMTDEEKMQVSEEKLKAGYTDYTKHYMDVGLIKLYDENQPLSLELSVASWVDTRFINKDGMVMIGKEIHQFTPTLAKKLKSGDFSKLELLKKTTEDNPKQDIAIGHLKDNQKDFHERIGQLHVRKTGTSWGDKRIEASIWVRRWDYTETSTCLYYFKINNYINKWWAWKQDLDADFYGYAFVRAYWESPADRGTQSNYVSFSYQDWHAYNVHVLWVDFPSDCFIRYEDSNYAWVKRDGVEGINIENDEATIY